MSCCNPLLPESVDRLRQIRRGAERRTGVRFGHAARGLSGLGDGDESRGCGSRADVIADNTRTTLRDHLVPPRYLFQRGLDPTQQCYLGWTIELDTVKDL